MKCKNLRIRTKNYQRYIYCIQKKEKIQYSECINCEFKEFKKQKELKKKSRKLKKLEDARFSIITNNLNWCYICQVKKKNDLNEVFGGSNRQMSMKYGLVIPVCRECHSEYDINKELRLKYQQEAQKIFEEKFSHELFMKEFKKNKLLEENFNESYKSKC